MSASHDDTTSTSGATSPTQLNNVADEGSDEDSYDAQYFGFTPQAFCDKVYDRLNSYVVEVMHTLETILLQKYAGKYPTEISAERVRQGMELELCKMRKSVTKSIDRLQIYLSKNLMHVPDHVILPEDEVAEMYQQYSEEDEKNIDEELVSLKERIRVLKHMKGALSEELTDLQQMKCTLKIVESDLDNVLSHLNMPDAFAKENILFIKNSMSSIRDKIAVVSEE